MRKRGAIILATGMLSVPHYFDASALVLIEVRLWT
jgi:hypothetical protein